MGIPPDFGPMVQQVSGQMQKKDALEILRHSWSQLSKQDKKLLKPLMEMMEIAGKTDEASKHKLHSITQSLKGNPELNEAFNHLYMMVSTPKRSKDDYMEARKTGAKLLEEAVHKVGLPQIQIHRRHS